MKLLLSEEKKKLCMHVSRLMMILLTFLSIQKDSGSYMERRYTGIRTVELLGLGTGNLDISFNGWHHTVKIKDNRKNTERIFIFDIYIYIFFFIRKLS